MVRFIARHLGMMAREGARWTAAYGSVQYIHYIISTQLGRAAGSGLIKGRKELGAEIGHPKLERDR